MKPVRLGSVTIPPLTAVVLSVLLLMYLVSGVLTNVSPSAAAFLGYLPVTTSGVLAGEVWRVFTYGLLHSLGDPFHLLFNGLMIFFFGRELEVRWGLRRSLFFLVATVIAGGVTVVLKGLLFGGDAAAVGASAYAEALIIAWGLTYRDREVRLYFLFPVRGIHMVFFAIFMWVLDAVSTSATSAAAHLGGMIMAAILVLGVWRPNAIKLFFQTALQKVGLRKRPKLYVVPSPGKGPDGKWVN